MGTRLTVTRVLALALVASTGGAAFASPSSVKVRTAAPCVVLTDASGDAGLSTEKPGSPANDSGLDLVAGVLSADRRVLDVAIRVSDLSAGIQVGRMWEFTFGSSQSPGAYYAVVATEQADGNGYAIYGPGDAQNKPPLASITGSLDPAHNTVHVQVPLRLLGHTGEFDTFTAASGRSIGTSGDVFRNTPLGQTAVGQPESTDVVSDTARDQRAFIVGRGCPR